jgi:hypothetical protein
MAFDINSASPTLDSAPSSTFSSGKFSFKQFNGLDHKIELFLDNSGNFEGKQETRFHINPAAVLGLNIEDMITNWVTEGSMTFMYMPEDVDSIIAGSTGQGAATSIMGAAQENGRTMDSYQFRGDGFDMLRVMVVPQTAGDSADGLNVNENDPKWILSYMFAIIDIEDVNELPELSGPGAAYMKCCKIRFHDVRQQILATSNIEYSTRNSPEAVYNTGCANDGILNTGKAILEIWNQALGDPEDGGCIEFIQTKDPETWDDGASEMFYTSPAGWSAADDIEYLYNHHVSKENLINSNPLGSELKELCVMHTKRPKSQQDLETVCITPFSKFFKKATEGDQPGELQLEHFFVTSHTNQPNGGNDPSRTFKAPMGQQDDRDLKTFKYGQIITYSFLDMAPHMNAGSFSTTPVYSVDIGQRKFKVKFKENDVKTARRLIAENYITELYPKQAANEKLFLPNIHTTKEKRNIFPTFALYGDQDPGGKGEFIRQKSGLLQLFYTGLFQNACICFKTFGLTLRESGTFIGIDKADKSENTDFSNKIYGQWFVVKVEHSFEAGVYMNNIYAIKIHRFEELKRAFEKTL